MFCEKCGKQINDDAAFCPFCGYTMGQPVENTISKVKTPGRKQPIDLFESSRITVCFGIGFAVLAILEVINWYFMSVVIYGEYNVSYAIPRLWYRSDYSISYNMPSLFYLLLLPVINIIFTAMFLTKKNVLYKVSTVYGIVGSVLIVSNYIYDLDTDDIKIIAVYVVALSLFITLLLLLKTKKKTLFIVSNIVDASYSLLYLLLLTSVVQRIDCWRVTSARVQVFVSIIVTIYEIAMYSFLIWYVYRQTSARKP